MPLFVKTFIQSFKFCLSFLRICFVSSMDIKIENLALRSQLSLFHQQIINKKISKPKTTPSFRLLWTFISKNYEKWKDILVLVKPDTVIKWHSTAFKLFWKRKSKHGRPCISPQTIAIIKRIHKQNPLLSPEKIHEQLCNLNVSDAPAPNTIEKYICKRKKLPGDKERKRQSWKTFLNNHRKELWSIDLCTIPTITFKILYAFIIVSHDRRKIQHFAVTHNPSSSWIIQQAREATPYGEAPRYLLHDNDSAFLSKDFQTFLSNANITSVRTSYHSPWQNGVVERTIGILRAELFNHMVPINESHLYKMLKEYVKYYNLHRTHQGIGCQTPVLSQKTEATFAKNTRLKATPVLGGFYHSYSKIA